MGEAARDAGIALLDLSASAPPVDVLRDQGFLEGFGVDVKDENVIGDENAPRIVGHDVTSGNEEGGRLCLPSRGIPIVLISHNLPHVFEVADRIHIHRLDPPDPPSGQAAVRHQSPGTWHVGCRGLHDRGARLPDAIAA